MNLGLIREYVLCSKYYTKQIGSCQVPTFIYSSKDGSRIDLIKNMKSELGRSDSSYVKNFKEDIKRVSKEIGRVGTDYIEEFPVVIDNRRLWNQILDYHSVPGDSEIRGRQYFLLDFFFPDPGYVVEIDSEYHNGREIYDNARDHYLQARYNLVTLRFGMYGKDDGLRENYIDQIKYTIRYFKKMGSYGGPRYIDQSNVIVENYMITNKARFEFIDQLYQYTRSSEITRSIAITMKDVDRISPENLGSFYCNPVTREMFLDGVRSMLWYIYGVDLYIQDTTEYSLHDILWVLDINSKPNKWKELSLCVGNMKVPGWITEIMGRRPGEYRRLIHLDIEEGDENEVENNKDNGIKDFLQAILRAKANTLWKPKI